MKRTLLAILLVSLIGGIGIYAIANNRIPFISPLPSAVHPKEKPLLAYAFPRLSQTVFPPEAITFGGTLSETDDSISQSFTVSVPAKPQGTSLLSVSGRANIPKKPGTYPVIVMLRGYVPRETFETGVGTQHAAEEYADAGFITLSPDFLGYGASASPSADPFEDRFQTYTTALSLLSSVSNLDNALSASYAGTIRADTDHIGLWGHSNGGHIALAVLAITKHPYPTVLWAPVSTSFPYSILYYTDEYDDQGKAMRKALAEFEETYNTDDFSPAAFYTDITAPIALYQGTNDEEVPVWWTRNLADVLTNGGSTVSYSEYEGADHNLVPSGWSKAVLSSLSFYKKYLK